MTTHESNTTKGRARKSPATTTPATKSRPRKASAKALAETIKAAAEAEVAEVIELKVRNRKASTTTARKPKAEPTTAPAPTTPTTPTALAGYVVRWPHAGYDLLKSDGTHDGATWLVRCNAHGATTEAANTKSGDQLGRKADRATWCAGCQA